MSYCRWSAYSNVYVIGTVDDQLECCGCMMLRRTARRTFYNESFYTPDAFEMIEHLRQHEQQGDGVPHWAIERLRIDGRTAQLEALGYVRQESRWQLPRQLGLTRTALTSHIYRGEYHWDRYPENYHCVGVPEQWVVKWAELIAKLPLPIQERRRALYRVAGDQRRRDAVQAALIAKAPRRVILDICTAELG